MFFSFVKTKINTQSMSKIHKDLHINDHIFCIRTFANISKIGYLETVEWKSFFS
tara:strand:+ start:387 stop:548 length:162 start_codon:yes stop_codon:yes gene_type:complete